MQLQNSTWSMYCLMFELTCLRVKTQAHSCDFLQLKICDLYSNWFAQKQKIVPSC